MKTNIFFWVQIGALFYNCDIYSANFITSYKNTKDEIRYENIGTINKIVVFVRFSGEPEFLDSVNTYEKIYSDTSIGAASLYNYYKEASYGKLKLNSNFSPKQGNGLVLSYQDAHPRNFYKFNTALNPIGYVDNFDSCIQRQNILVKNIIDFLNNSLPDSINIDYNNDGYADMVSTIISGKHETPFKWTLILWEGDYPYPDYNTTDLIIKGKKLGWFEFLFQDIIKSEGHNYIAHETFHSLGAPDLKHYNWDNLDPIGRWDNMGVDQKGQQYGAYMRFRYGHWIDSIPRITKSGGYSLKPLNSGDKNCFQLKSPNSATEYFVLEYRKKEGAFDKVIPGSGLLVYRINTKADGKGDGYPPDEVYIMRPGGSINAVGDLFHAFLNKERNCLSDTSKFITFLSNGEKGGISIFNIFEQGDSILFEVELNPPSTIEAFGNRELKMYPNPAVDVFRIRTPEKFDYRKLIEVYDPTGRLIHSQTLPASQQGEEISIDLSAFANGMYLVKLSSGGKVYYGKVLLVK